FSVRTSGRRRADKDAELRSLLDVEGPANDLRASQPGGKSKHPRKDWTAVRQRRAGRNDGEAGEDKQLRQIPVQERYRLDSCRGPEDGGSPGPERHTEGLWGLDRRGHSTRKLQSRGNVPPSVSRPHPK